MDLTLSGATPEESLMSQLSYKVGDTGATYITGRRSVNFYPTGANTFSHNAVRVARISLGSEVDFLDPETLRISFDLVKNAPRPAEGEAGDHFLIPAAGPHCFISRLLLYAGGVLIEDVDFYGRCHEMILSPFFNKRISAQRGNSGRIYFANRGPATRRWSN